MSAATGFGVRPDGSTHDGESPPRQERSRRSRRRLLRAAAEVVAERGVDGARVSDIAARAGMSVGNVYRRFESKEVLIRALEEEFLAGREGFWEDLLAPERWAGRPLESFVSAVVEETIGRHARNRALLRAVATRARAEYETRVPAVGEGPGLILTERILALWPDRVTRPDARRAIRLAFEAMFASVGELLLFRRGGIENLDMDEAALADELTLMVVRYITGPSASKKR